MPNQYHVPRNLSLAYFLFSVLWIACSEEVVSLISPNASVLFWLSASKGWVFVSLTALLLYRTLCWWEMRWLQSVEQHRQAELALEESEGRFRQMADNIQEVFWLSDPEKNNVLFVSSAFESIWERSCQELYSNPRSWLEAIHPQDQPGVLESLPGQLNGTYDQTYRIITPAGEERWIHDRAFPVRNERGEIFRLAGVARDVTLRVQTARSLEQSEERYRCLVDLSPEGILVIAEGKIVYVNPSCLQLFGGSAPEQAVGKSVLDFVHPDSQAALVGRMQAISSGQVTKAEALERRFVRLDGTEFVGETTGVAFSHEGGPAVLAIIRDVSERNRIRQEMEQQRSHLAAIVQSSSDGLVAVDHQDKILWFNPAAESIFQISSAQAQGQHWNHFMRPTASGRPLGLRGQGVTFPLEASSSVAHLESGPVRTWTLQDLSEREQAEQKRQALEIQLRQAQKMEALGQLAGGVAHDFNNLLTVVIGSAEMLKPSSCEDQECLADIVNAADKASDLTRQLLTFSRKQRIQRVNLDLTQLIGDFTIMLRRLVGEHITIRTDFQAGLPAIHADPGMMEQILMNLVVNSRDAMPEGGTLSISTSEVTLDQEASGQVISAGAGRYVCLKVSDTGCGMPQEDLLKIFDPFFTTKEVGRGTGLGLATVYGIVEQHQGGIHVSSEPGRGTSFQIFLPALKLAERAEPRKPAAQLVTGCETILIAEDDPALQSVMKKVLTRCGYQVLTASSALEAIGLWNHHQSAIELVITDLVMPGGMSGLELGRRLLQERSSLKILYSSGYSQDLTNNKGLEIGENFLAKPYSSSQLAQSVRCCLDNPVVTKAKDTVQI